MLVHAEIAKNNKCKDRERFILFTRFVFTLTDSSSLHSLEKNNLDLQISAGKPGILLVLTGGISSYVCSQQ